MTARELGFLSVPRREFVANAIEQLHVALLRVLLQGSDKGPRHGASGLRSNRSIGTRVMVSSSP